MKKLIKFLFAKQLPRLEQCAPFQIKKEESDTLYGGFREYTPPIYEKGIPNDSSFKTTELLTDINQIKK